MEIAPVREAEKGELWGHLQAYIRELLPYASDAARPNRVAPYPYFETYWQEPESRWAFWGLRAGVRAGFALVRKGPQRYEMAEFYCLPAFRRLGFGLAFARAVIGRFPGAWEITEFAGNTGAVAFWRRVLADVAFDEGSYIGERSGQRRLRQTFVVHR